MSTPCYDIAIIGGGIVGLATAMALTEQYTSSVIVLEAEDRLAAHQTGNNSGVIHSGLYYRPGSLKARNCVEGREALYRFCEENNISHDRCGKVVVATDASEIPALGELERRGNANGLKGLKRLTPEEIRDYEPYVTGVAGLLVPETGIVDFVQVTETYAQKVLSAGGQVKTGTRVTGFRKSDREFVLETNQDAVHCRHLINCGGLYCDRIARMCGINPGVRIVPFRGEYYELVPERHSLVNNLIYPVPNPAFPFLGVHFTRMIQGGVEVGPNAVLAFKREGYRKTDFSLRDSLETFTYSGFLKMAFKFWKVGMGEFHRSFSKRAFVKALKKLVPEIEIADIHPAGAGVRAQAIDPKGRPLDDFCIVEAERMVHVLNAPSPAATASISIGQSIAKMAIQNFDLKE